MTDALALLPPIAAAGLLLRGHRPTLAALVAYVFGLALLVAFPTPLARLLRAEWQALLTAIEVCAIILGGITFDELTRRSGTTVSIGAWLRATTSDATHAALLIVLGLTPFFESITGFGVGAVIAVSLLRTIGFGGFKLGALGLLGLVTVPWGALAPGTLVAARLADLSFQALGIMSAALSLPVFLVAGWTALILAAGWLTTLRRWPLVLRGALSLWLGILAANTLLGTPLAGALGSLLAIVALAWPLRTRGISRQQARAMLPYAVLVALLILGRVAARLVTAWSVRAAAVLASPILALALTCAGLLWHSYQRDRSLAWMMTVWRRWQPVALTTLLFVLLGGVMVASGMATALARLVASFGPAYIGLAPWLGGLGGFLTGSNTGANAMFATAQAQAARALGLQPLLIVAAQNVGAALFTMASPPRVSLALSLLDPAERDWRVGHLALLVDGLAAALLSLVLLGIA